MTGVHSDHRETARNVSDTSSTISSESGSNVLVDETNALNRDGENSDMPQCTLLDLYSGCGAMSTGLCMGASISGVKLVTVCRLICLMQCDVYPVFF